MAEQVSQPDQMSNSNNGLEKVEYVVAAAAIGGTIATVVLKQAIFAVAPLSLAVLLNLLNRRRLDQLIRQANFADTSQVQRQLTDEIYALRQQVNGLPVMTPANVTHLNDSLNIITASEIPALKSELEQLRTQLDQNHAAAAASQQESLLHEIQQLKVDMAQLQHQTVIPEPEESPNLSSLQADLAAMLVPVQTEMAALEAKVNALPTAATEAPVQTEQVLALEHHLGNLETKLDQVATQLAEGKLNVQQLIEQTEGRMAEMHQRLTAVQETPPPAAVDTTNLYNQLQETLQPLQHQLASLEGQVNALSLPDPAVMQSQSEQLSSLQSQLDQLGLTIEHLSNQFATEIAQTQSLIETTVQSRIAEVKHEVQQQAVGSQPASSEFDELDNLLAGLDIKLE